MQQIGALRKQAPALQVKGYQFGTFMTSYPVQTPYRITNRLATDIPSDSFHCITTYKSSLGDRYEISQIVERTSGSNLTLLQESRKIKGFYSSQLNKRLFPERNHQVDLNPDTVGKALWAKAFKMQDFRLLDELLSDPVFTIPPSFVELSLCFANSKGLSHPFFLLVISRRSDLISSETNSLLVYSHIESGLFTSQAGEELIKQMTPSAQKELLHRLLGDCRSGVLSFTTLIQFFNNPLCRQIAKREKNIVETVLLQIVLNVERENWMNPETLRLMHNLSQHFGEAFTPLLLDACMGRIERFLAHLKKDNCVDLAFFFFCRGSRHSSFQKQKFSKDKFCSPLSTRLLFTRLLLSIRRKDGIQVHLLLDNFQCNLADEQLRQLQKELNAGNITPPKSCVIQ